MLVAKRRKRKPPLKSLRIKRPKSITMPESKDSGFFFSLEGSLRFSGFATKVQRGRHLCLWNTQNDADGMSLDLC
jgi:hypothetical protein